MRTAPNDMKFSGIDRAGTVSGSNAELSCRKQRFPDVVILRAETVPATLPVLDHRIPGASLDQLRRMAVDVACVTYLPGARFDQHPDVEVLERLVVGLRCLDAGHASAKRPEVAS